jgi:hypothetical protein
MAEKSSWRMEVNNPKESSEWRILWIFVEDQCHTYQELADELNQINYPIKARIVPDTD